MRQFFCRWEELPECMQIPEVRYYWEILNKRYWQIVVKRFVDVLGASILLVVLFPAMVVIAIAVKADSPGHVLYRQERVTQYGKRFRIHKFRTMLVGADKTGALVTVDKDNRITKVGEVLRHYRLDEFPQLLDVLTGDMSFVGTRPEVVEYVDRYKPEYLSTLLLPAGVTSNTSIEYSNESRILEAECDVERIYIESVLPEKMKINLRDLERFSVINDLSTVVRTVAAVFYKK